MPKRRVSMLKTICLRLIAKNIPSYSNEELQNFPWDLSEELIQVYDEEFELCLQSNEYDISRLRDRNRMISQNIRCLNILFPNCNEELCKDTITCVFKTCRSLTSLTCNDEGKLPDQDLLELVQSIPNIVELILPNKDSGNDDILAAIGDSCPKLEILRFLSSRITDDGIRQLIQSKCGGCNIKSLMLGDQVTSDGCLIALLNFKQLRVFNSLKVIAAFVNLFRHLDGLAPPTFELRELPRIVMEKIPPRFLKFLIESCPKITSLDLSIRKYYDYHLNEFKSCSAYSIKLYNCLWWIDDSSLPDMNEIGSNITTLHLYGGNVDLPYISYACPNLETLLLIDVGYLMIARNAYYPATFKKLIRLALEAIPVGHLKFLLEHCLNLQSLECTNTSNLDDEIVTSVLDGVNPLKHLTRLVFDRCNSISKISILKMLDTENELKLLIIRNCRDISKQDLTAIKDHVKKNNYPVELHGCAEIESSYRYNRGSKLRSSLKECAIVFVVGIMVLIGYVIVF